MQNRLYQLISDIIPTLAEEEEVVLEEANKFVTTTASSSLCKIRECPLLVPLVNFLVILSINELARSVTVTYERKTSSSPARKTFLKNREFPIFSYKPLFSFSYFAEAEAAAAACRRQLIFVFTFLQQLTIL